MKANDLYPRLLATMLTAFVEAAFYELRPSVPFQHGLYIRAMCHLLERVERGESGRL